MSCTECTVAEHIAAPVEDVWAVITDISNAADTLSAVTKIEIMEHGDTYKVGTRWRETRTVMRQQATEELWVSAVEPMTRTVVKAHSRGTDYTTTFELTPQPGGTLLTVNFVGEQPDAKGAAKLLAKVTSPLGKSIVKRHMEQDLADISAAAQRRQN